MRIFFLISFIFLTTVFNFSVNAEIKPKTPVNSKAIELGMHKKLFGASVTTAAVLDIKGETAVLYGAANKLLFRLGDKPPIVVANEGVSDKGAWLHKANNKIYALWWRKLKEGKQLKIKSSDDNGKTFSEEPSFITKYGVLPQIKIADDGKDKIAVAYISEREPGYQIYFNRSIDAGKTWFKDDIRLNELYNNKGPVLGNAPLKDKQGKSHVSAIYIDYFENKLVIVWQESSIFEGKLYLRIVTKISKDDGMSWSDENEVYRHPDVSPQEMSVTRMGDELLISAFIPKTGLVTFASSKMVGNWKQLDNVPNTKDLEYASAMQATKNDGKNFLTYTSKSEGSKDQIKVVVNETNKQSWVDISSRVIGDSELIAKDKNNQTKSSLSLIGSIGNTIIAIWQDHQYLLPILHINYSQDGGETWLKRPVLLAPPGKVMMKYPSLHASTDSIWLNYTYMDYSIKGFKQGLYGSRVAELTSENKVKINIPNQDDLFVKINEEEKLKLLKKRSKAFWDTRIAQDHKSLLAFFDPIYRSSYTKESYARTQGKIQFLAADTGEVTVDGNLGYITTNLKVVLTMLANMMDEATVPKPKDVNARWGWFYDNWYLMPHTLFKRDYDF